MKDVRVDADGNLRCWKCGSKNFLAKRTGRAHIIGYTTLGIGALMTKKKLKCQQCGTYNQVGKAKPLPASPPQPGQHVPDIKLDRLRQLGELKANGVITDEEFEVQKAEILGA